MNILFTRHSHVHAIFTQGLFVQTSLSVLSIIGRLYVFLGRLQEEVPREARKALLKLSDHSERDNIRAEFGLPDDSEKPLGPEEILSAVNVKDAKRPAGQEFKGGTPHKKGKPQGKPSSFKGKSDAIDDIFGSI